MQSPRPKPQMKDILEALIDEMVSKGILWREAAAQFEKLFILRVFQECGGNLGKTAERMGVHRNTLSKKMREHEIGKKDVLG